MKLPWFVAIALATGCAAQLDELETDEIEQAALSCPGCGMNGFSETAYNWMWGQFDRNALAATGAWSGDAPLTFCRPATVTSTGCKLRYVYGAWLRTGQTNIRVEIMTNVVKLIAPQGFWIHDDYDASGHFYQGMFDLAPRARNVIVDYPEQERISAGLLALLNAVKDVPVCLLTKHQPSHCAGSTAYWHESVTFGKHFRHPYLAIAGGSAAPDPAQNHRYGNAKNAQANEVLPSNKCNVSGTGEGRHALSCSSASNVVWNHPVTVLTPHDPKNHYYGPGPITKPPMVFDY
jgi:hypothetical protein